MSKKGEGGGRAAARAKFLNAPDTCVADSLAGFVAVNTGVRILKGCNAVVRHDYEQLAANGTVALLSGGGSGHEPGFAGFVGPGMLTAAVAGPVYTSPFSDCILATLRTVASKNKAGVLVFVLNYTGDRLTFGIALEKAATEGIHADIVFVAEDTAITHTHASTGRRGLCGAIFMMKIAGAMAEEHRTLEEIKAFIEDKKQHMGTITVALTPCSLPGKDEVLFNLPADKMELGMGIHGEAGVSRLPVLCAAETAMLMVNHLRNEQSKNSLHLNKGDHVALMLNNLGALTTLEMNILAKEVISYLESLGIHVVRAYSGLYVTSLESAGLSICVLKVDTDVLGYLDAPTLAPAWVKPYCLALPRCTPAEVEPVASRHLQEEKLYSTKGEVCVLNNEERELFRAVLQAVFESLVAREKELDKLDSESGDGDCGATLAAGARACLAYLRTRPPLEHPGLVLRQLSHTVSSSMGGTSGALYSLLLLGASRAFQLHSGFRAWVTALELGMELVFKYGMARVGDRTMLDSLDAVQTVLQKSAADYQPEQLPGILSEALDAVSAATTATRTMRARAGRASYVNPDALKHPDPGARAVEIWISCAIRVVLADNRASGATTAGASVASKNSTALPSR